MEIVRLKPNPEASMTLSEQHDIASWETLIRVIREIGDMPIGDIDEGNSYILKFCREFKNNKQILIDQLQTWSMQNSLIINENLWNIVRIGSNLGFYKNSGEIETNALVAIDIIYQDIDELTEVILEESDYSRFNDIIPKFVENYTSIALNNMHNQVSALDSLSIIREEVKFYIEY
jgi:hypothetical protein